MVVYSNCQGNAIIDYCFKNKSFQDKFKDVPVLGESTSCIKFYTNYI